MYRTSVSRKASWRFTILLLGEIERQLEKAPLAAVIKIKGDSTITTTKA